MGFTLSDFFEDCIATIKPAFFISITFLSQALIITTDIIVLGWLGIEFLASSGYAIRMYMPLFLLTLGFSVCVTVLAGRAMGAKNYTHLRLVVRRLLIMGFVFGTLCTIVLIFAIRPIMEIWGIDEILIQNGHIFMAYFAFTLPFAVFTVGIRNFMTVVGRSSPFMYLSLFMVVVNGVLDYGLGFGVWGFSEMGITGVALSSTVVNIISATILIVMCRVMSPYKKFKIFTKMDYIVTDKIVGSLRMSMALSSKMVVETAFYTLCFFLTGLFGAEYLASYQIVYQIDTNIFLFGIGVGVAISSRVAYGYGAKDMGMVKLSALSGCFILTVFTFICGVLSYVYGEDIADIFLAGDSPSIIKTHSLIVEMLFVLMLYQGLHGLSFGIGSAVDGMGRPTTTMKSFFFTMVIVGSSIAIYLTQYTDTGALSALWATALATLVNTLIMGVLWYRRVNELQIEIEK